LKLQALLSNGLEAFHLDRCHVLRFTILFANPGNYALQTHHLHLTSKQLLLIRKQSYRLGSFATGRIAIHQTTWLIVSIDASILETPVRLLFAVTK
jgi:hypothetical protein